MRIAIASDHAGFIQKAPIAEYIESLGHEVIDFGPENDDRVDYPDYADKVARYVAAGSWRADLWNRSWHCHDGG